MFFHVSDIGSLPGQFGTSSLYVVNVTLTIFDPALWWLHRVNK